METKNFLLTMALSVSLLSANAQQVWTPDNGDGTFTNPVDVLKSDIANPVQSLYNSRDNNNACTTCQDHQLQSLKTS